MILYNLVTFYNYKIQLLVNKSLAYFYILRYNTNYNIKCGNEGSDFLFYE